MSNFVNEAEKDFREVGKFAREIVAKRVAIVAVITIVLNLAVSNGWITPDWSDHVTSVVTSILDAIAGLTAVAIIRPAVTPVKAPQDNDGTPLVPLGSQAAAAPVEEPEVDPNLDVYTQVSESNAMNNPENQTAAQDDPNRPLPVSHTAE